MSVVQNLYQIFKIPASFLVSNDCKIDDYTISRGLKEGNVVSIGDNMVFQQLRYIHGDYRNHKELFNYVTKLRNNMHAYKKQGLYKEASILNQKIVKVLFVKDIINVFIDKAKSDFHKFRTKGFDFNGEHYVYLCSGSGQIRRNTATFINAKYREQIVDILNCGLDKKTSEFVLAKYSAYFALSFSSVLWVRTPRVCVIKDFYKTIPNQSVDFICKDKDGKSIIEERKMDIDLNCADGQGLIDPEFAKLWAEDMSLPFLPCSFVARSAFIKGNLVTFDFKEYARQNNIEYIRDKWGIEYRVEDIDVLLSESQFKTHKYYNSWQEYQSYAQKGNIPWGVARYTKHHDDEYVLANYQYIQSLTLDKEDIHNLVQPTIEWIQQICSGDTLATLLYAFGPKTEDIVYQQMYSIAQTNPMKAIIKNIDFLQDSYVQRKIYKNITKSINDAKLGKIWIRGNYQFMIADPVAQCQSALGLEPVGVLKADQVWSNFWKERIGMNCTLDLCRSPMIDLHEHNPCTLITDNEEANYWFRYLPSGMIYSVYDTSCARHSDSDYDGDIVLSTDNMYFIKGSNKDHNIITYEKGLAKPAKINISNITATVMKGFGTGVGGFSNTATCLYAMAAIFNNPEQKEQHDELMNRIKLLREIVGQEIDRIKGADKPSLPAEWKKFESILPTDTPEERLKKFRHNSMVVSKKPYFFRYLYPELNQRFKQFEASYNQVSRDMFGLKFKKLLKKEDKTEEELNLVRNYQKYSPLITSDCTMNRVCREFEAVDFDIQFAKDFTDKDKKRPTVSMLPTFADEYESQYDQQKYKFVYGLYKSYTARKQIKHLNALLADSLTPLDGDDYAEVRSTVYSALIQELQNQLAQTDITGSEFLYYCYKISQNNKQFNWGFPWDILEDQIIQLIPRGKTYCPVRDPAGKEYLGATYSLKDITNTTNPAIKSLVNNIINDPQEPPEEELVISKDESVTIDADTEEDLFDIDLFEDDEFDQEFENSIMDDTDGDLDFLDSDTPEGGTEE